MHNVMVTPISSSTTLLAPVESRIMTIFFFGLFIAPRNMAMTIANPIRSGIISALATPAVSCLSTSTTGKSANAKRLAHKIQEATGIFFNPHSPCEVFLEHPLFYPLGSVLRSLASLSICRATKSSKGFPLSKITSAPDCSIKFRHTTDSVDFLMRPNICSRILLGVS